MLHTVAVLGATLHPRVQRKNLKLDPATSHPWDLMQAAANLSATTSSFVTSDKIAVK